MGFSQYSQEDGGEDEPGGQKDSERVGELVRVIGVGGGNTEAGVEDGSIGQPETPVTAES
jgi:hypothetical protein